jgi:hypothetical protein
LFFFFLFFRNTSSLTAQTTESQNDLGSWEPLQTITSSLYTTTHTTKENKNCADEEGAAIPGTAKAPAATSPHNNNHLHNTLLLQLQMLLLFSIRLHVRLNVSLSVPVSRIQRWKL